MKDLAYNVLLLSSSSTFHAVLKSLLPPSNYPSVCSAYSVRTAKEFLNEQQFDLILVDTPLADASGKLFALEACRKKGTVVLLFIKQELFDEVNAFLMQDVDAKFDFEESLQLMEGLFE